MSEAGVEAQLVEQLHDALLDSADLHGFLDRLAQHAAEIIDAAGRVTYTVLLVRGPRERNASSETVQALALEELRIKYDDGPSLSALRTGNPVLVHDVLSEARWPALMREAATMGVGSILAIPFCMGTGGTGAVLSCYHGEGHGFSAADCDAASAYVRIAAKPLLLAERLDRLARRTADLEAALESRTTINLAAGIVMGQNSCSHRDAMEILRRASNARNVKLRDVARGIVEPLSGPAATHFDD